MMMPYGDMKNKAAIDEDEEAHYSVSDGESEVLLDDSPRHDDKARKEEIEAIEAGIAKRESKSVVRLRIVVALVLLFSAIGVSTGVYFYTSEAEQAKFEEQFHSDAIKVFESIGSALDRTLGAMDSYATNVVLTAKDKRATWPYVVMPDFALRAAKVLSQTKATWFGVYHLVTSAQRQAWENYTLASHGWIDECIAIQEKGLNDTYFGDVKIEWEAPGYINGGWDLPAPERPVYFPVWQNYPAYSEVFPIYNFDAWAVPFVNVERAVKTHHASISQTYLLPDPDDAVAAEYDQYMVNWLANFLPSDRDSYEPIIDVYYPILDDMDSVRIQDPISHPLRAMLAVSIYWRDLLVNILPPGSEGILIVFENECNPAFTFQINGPEVAYLGRNDLHDSRYDHLDQGAWLLELEAFSNGQKTYSGLPIVNDTCPYYLRLFPSLTMEDDYTSSNPALVTACTVLIFAFTSLVFILYDWTVERRQRKVMASAVQTSAIVSSLFPSNVRDRLFNAENASPGKATGMESLFFSGFGGGSGYMPIADLYPSATVMFADIANFTAWSSTRNPAMVFTLLEAVYSAFDKIADSRSVFKVETIGDSYVAVCGLPDPNKDHCIVMAKFARNCLQAFNSLVRELQVQLGPDTADLQLRIGLHTGPVTAGVLRGQKSRFQLFGDTVNTAARMESTSIPNKIQISREAADLLNIAGKEHWVKPREVLIEAKGKGTLQTYWLLSRVHGGTKSVNTDSEGYDMTDADDDKGEHRPVGLVEWNAEILVCLVKQIIARRNATKSKEKLTRSVPANSFESTSGMVLDEVKEIVELPVFDPTVSDINPDLVVLSPRLRAEIHQFVSIVQSLYHDNPFHNFEHASHVAMSVVKMLGRIVNPKDLIHHDVAHKEICIALHDHSYGINSDPLTQFACVFAALIHDLDHPGVPNTQLIKEGTHLAARYNNKSVAEQNSVDIAWAVFMGDEFRALREAVCPTAEEKKRFRQLVVNSVMATDIMDKDLKDLRNARWEKAFSEAHALASTSNARDNVNRKATIVIEHLIQASDIAHTMQHWHIYRKWNERLFEEIYSAYQAGRCDKDPTEFWYKGEIGFFDFYIIPLTKKLRDCGVFGVSSDEYLNYAENNRAEWERRGEEIVAAMVEKVRSQK